jgi:hypothetical protein
MNLLDFYKLTKEKNILLSFKGALSQEILVEMGNLIKSHLSMSKKIKKIFAVFVELSQNIMHYSDEKEYVSDISVGVGIILFIESDDTYIVLSGNLINNDKVESLRTRIENLKNLTQDELKNLYNEQIRNSRESESKGAGLGFIEICRKSDSNVNCEFFPYDDNNSFFTFVVNISKDSNNG